MKRIIVPTDFSVAAWNAIIHAVKLAQEFNSELILLHVFENASPQMDVSSISLTESLTTEEERLVELVDNIHLIEPGIKGNLKSYCLVGTLIDRLNDMVDGSGQEIIIMGTEGRVGKIQKLLGSSSSKIMKNLYCPLLIVPKGLSFLLSTPVVCAIDFGSEINESDLTIIKKLIEKKKPNVLKVVHIANKDDNSNNLLPLGQFRGLNPQFEEIIGDKIPNLLEDYAKINRSNLIIVVRKERGFFENLLLESVSNELAFNAKTPVLIVRSKKL